MGEGEGIQLREENSKKGEKSKKKENEKKGEKRERKKRKEKGKSKVKKEGKGRKTILKEET